MADKGQCCKTCKHLEVAPTPSGRRVVRRDGAYKCVVPSPEFPALPDSITKAYSFGSLPRRWMSGHEGTSCPLWEPVKR